MNDLSIHEEEKGTSAAIIRGIAARFASMGVNIGGFDAYSTSDVLSGSGLSSSAAFETLVGAIININYNDCRADEAEIAKIGQYAENVYFGKGSGLLDQTVCAYGGFVFIDFLDTDKPYVEKYSFDFEKAGYKADSEKDVFSLRRCPMCRRTAQAVRLSSCFFSSAWLVSLGRANVPM